MKLRVKLKLQCKSQETGNAKSMKCLPKEATRRVIPIKEAI
jgi:hypothetical protein